MIRKWHVLGASVAVIAVVGLLYPYWVSPGSVRGGPVRVLYAGSLINTFEQGLAPAFENEGYSFEGEGHGSVQNALFIVNGQRFPDVYVSAGVEPMDALLAAQPPKATWYVAFSSDELVIGYSNRSRFFDQFEAARQGLLPWYQVLSDPAVKFLRTDPQQDPKGYYTIIMARLADRYYGNASISQAILRGDRNPDQLRPEEVLRTLLETGECDAIPLYKHEAVERDIPYISLPPQVNLGSPDFADTYRSVSYTLANNVTVYGEPIVFTVTIPSTATNVDGAVAFVRLLLSEQGQGILRAYGFGSAKFTVGGRAADVPEGLKPYVGG